VEVQDLVMDKQFLPEIIHGETVTLKKHQVELADKMYRYVVEDRQRLARFLPWPDFIATVHDEVDFINNCSEEWQKYATFSFGIFRNSDSEYMGNLSAFGINWKNCSCELGYWILGKFEGQGHISSAVRLLEATLFGMGFNRIVIRCDPKNLRSASVPKRLHYVFEGVQREVSFRNDGFHDLSVYSKLKSDYP